MLYFPRSEHITAVNGKHKDTRPGCMLQLQQEFPCVSVCVVLDEHCLMLTQK